MKKVINTPQGPSWHYNSKCRERLCDNYNIDGIFSNPQDLRNIFLCPCEHLWLAGIPAWKQYQAAVGTVRLLTRVHTDGLLIKPTALLTIDDTDWYCSALNSYSSDRLNSLWRRFNDTTGTFFFINLGFTFSLSCAMRVSNCPQLNTEVF